MTRRNRNRWLGVTLAAAAAAVVSLPQTASAQDVSPTGKGITGGILLGAEVALITTAAVGAKSWWPYVLFGAVGAGGGAVGGYFVEQVDQPEPSLYMLAGGMALVIPTVVAVLNATAYDPTDDEEVEEGEEPSGLEDELTTGKAQRLPMALIGVDAFDGTRISLGLPVVEVRQSYTPTEVVAYGVAQQTEYHLPIVRGSF